MGNTYYNIQCEKNGVKEHSTGSLLWRATKFISKVTWIGSKFIVKNAPAAFCMAWEIKKEISNEIAQTIQEGQKFHKEDLLKQQISALKQIIKHKELL